MRHFTITARVLQRSLRRSTPTWLAGLVTLWVASIGAAADDPALRGCWRSQQARVTFADGSHRDQNGDCVTEFEAGKMRSRCHAAAGDTENVSGFEVITPGRVRVTPLKPAGPPSDLQYSVRDDWLIFERPIVGASSVASGKQPVSLKTVSIGVKSECKPRGESQLRVGNTPVSSIALTVPTGWEPLPVDPVKGQRLAPAIGSDFLIGAFVPTAADGRVAARNLFVLLTDDVRSGPVPVRATGFAAVKKRFANESASAKLMCDLPDRVCASLTEHNGAQVYTELVNVSGRVVMVSSTVPQASAGTIELLRQSVRVFVDQVRKDNPN